VASPQLSSGALAGIAQVTLRGMAPCSGISEETVTVQRALGRAASGRMEQTTMAPHIYSYKLLHLWPSLWKERLPQASMAVKQLSPLNNRRNDKWTFYGHLSLLVSCRKNMSQQTSLITNVSTR